jgi:hypothetical protein
MAILHQPATVMGVTGGITGKLKFQAKLSFIHHASRMKIQSLKFNTMPQASCVMYHVSPWITCINRLDLQACFPLQAEIPFFFPSFENELIPTH